MSTVRENIIANLKTTLEAITQANGYNNDIASVQRWMQRGNILKSVPCIVISAGQEDKKPEPNPLMTCRLSVYLELYLRQNETDQTPTDSLINSLLGDIEKALMLDYTRGSFALDTNIRAIMPFETQEGQANAGAVIEIEILYQHQQNNPEEG
ncbi:MAG: hypothetical protein PHO42_06370 [Candidatus Omnitrophica bacterium]|nr:hypothetical protein [Candidatus Omnitrophota bacterium]